VDKRRAFRDAFRVLARRIELFASLPLDKLSGLALQERVRQIGKA
jgi:arsenate reductase (thioredoxin)